MHQSIKANFLMSPPLVVAFALAGRIDIDMANEPLGQGDDGEDVYLRDIWPTHGRDPRRAWRSALDAGDVPQALRELRRAESALERDPDDRRTALRRGTRTRPTSRSRRSSTGFGMEPGKAADITGARALAIFGDSVTTDHISPAGSIKATSPAGKYLIEQGVPVEDFNSYGSRRGNDRVMTRGTFANVRIKNLMVPGVEGGVTVHQPDGDADVDLRRGDAVSDRKGRRSWSSPARSTAPAPPATGPRKARSSSACAPSSRRASSASTAPTSSAWASSRCNSKKERTRRRSRLDGTETFDITGITGDLRPRQKATLVIHRANGATENVPLIVRIDTPIEVDYYEHGGILPFVLRQLIGC